MYLNGIRVSPIVEFDEESGWVIVVSLDDRGKPYAHPLSPVGHQCRKYMGKVQCKLLPPHAEDTEPLIHGDWVTSDRD